VTLAIVSRSKALLSRDSPAVVGDEAMALLFLRFLICVAWKLIAVATPP
jgi:hypothetical protein